MDNSTQHYPVGALRMFDRLVRLITGAIMIGIVMMDHDTMQPLGWLSVIALVAIYPILSGMLGWELFLPWRQTERAVTTRRLATK